METRGINIIAMEEIPVSQETQKNSSNGLS